MYKRQLHDNPNYYLTDYLPKCIYISHVPKTRLINFLGYCNWFFYYTVVKDPADTVSYEVEFLDPPAENIPLHSDIKKQ